MPAETKVVIALGGRAARRRFPTGTSLVTALTPGVSARAKSGAGRAVRIQMDYAPDEFARRVRRLKPDVRRVVVLWSLRSSDEYARAAREDAKPLGLDVIPVQVTDQDELPSLLRSLPAADAIWLSPDPGLVTASTFDAAHEYARSRGLTFFSPAPGLAERGADPCLAPSFRDAGLQAGKAARALLAGRVVPDIAYPDPDDDAAKGMMVSTATSPDQ